MPTGRVENGIRTFICPAHNRRFLRCGKSLCTRQGTRLVKLLLEHIHVAFQVADIAPQLIQYLIQYLAFRLIRVLAGFAYDGQLRALRVFRNKTQQFTGIYLALLTEHGHLFRDVLQLPHVARPLVLQQQLLGLIVQRNLRQMVFLSHLHGKQSEQENDVFASVSEWRHLDRNRVQAIEQILTEPTLTDGLAHVHIRCGHDAHVRLHDLLPAHTDILTRFQHTQQPCLRGKRQFAHLVKEYRSLVCRSEVALALAHGTRERPFLVAEQFAVNRSFRDRATVDGKVFLASARRVVVNDARNNLFTDTTFAHNQHRQVRRSHLQRDVQGPVQPVTITYDIVALFYSLQFRCIH